MAAAQRKASSSQPNNDQKLCPANNDATSWAATLLAAEANIREIRDKPTLFADLTNSARRLLGFRQAFFLKARPGGKAFFVAAASSIAVIDRDAPMVRWIEKIVDRLRGDAGLDGQRRFSLPAYCDDSDEERSSYPFPEFLWSPLMDGSEVVGGLLISRERPWQDGDQALATRLCDCYAQAWRAIEGQGRIVRTKILTKKRAILGAAFLGVLCLLPVNITALAPVEVAPLDPFVIAAPFDGVVEDMLIDPGAKIHEGDVVINFEDVHQRNEFELAARREAVAEARFLRASQGAISDPRAKRELDVAKTEHELAKAEKIYANDLFAKTRLASPRSGIAIFSDKRDWIGRPVAAGEAIMQIADPNRLRFAIDLPINESLVIEKGARIKIFLDSDPLKPIDATLVEASYQPKIDKRDVLAYRLSAEIKNSDGVLPRIGVQGSAKIYGEKAPLIYVLLRRPFAALRQMTGL